MKPDERQKMLDTIESMKLIRDLYQTTAQASRAEERAAKHRGDSAAEKAMYFEQAIDAMEKGLAADLNLDGVVLVEGP